MKIKKLRQVDKDGFEVLWEDGHQGAISVHRLRDSCPCAGCKGETILLQSYVPPPPDKSVPGRYEIRSVETVGGYAMKFGWGDGHALGLYTWEHLRRLCQCGCQGPL